MKFKSTIELESAPFQIKHNDKITLIGSCFTEHIGSKLKEYKFQVLQNPFGTVFHPTPICWLIKKSLSKAAIEDKELEHHDEIYFHDQFHYSFSNTNASSSLEKMNTALKHTSKFLKTSNFLFLSLGTAIGYLDKKKKRTVANCHKLPKDSFLKSHTGVKEMMSELDEMISAVHAVNPAMQVIFTLSPVRHLKDGMLENSKSKAALLIAIQTLVDQFSYVHYFPSFEIMMDDLRDYRYYEMDLVHPNALAQAYIWEKFNIIYFKDETTQLNLSLQKINQAYHHKVFHASSRKHEQFLEKFKTTTETLLSKYPNLDLRRELSYFSTGLKASSS